VGEEVRETRERRERDERETRERRECVVRESASGVAHRLISAVVLLPLSYTRLFPSTEEEEEREEKRTREAEVRKLWMKNRNSNSSKDALVENYDRDYGDFLKNLRRINALLELKQEKLAASQGIDEDDDDDDDDDGDAIEVVDEDEEEIEAEDEEVDDVVDDDEEYQVIEDEDVYTQEWGSSISSSVIADEDNNNTELSIDLKTPQDKKLLRPSRVFESLPDALFDNVVSTSTSSASTPLSSFSSAPSPSASYRPRWNLRDFEVGNEIGRGFYAIVYRF